MGVISIVIEEYLVDDSELFALLGGAYLWLVEKPSEMNANPYITYTYKEIKSDFIKDYQFEFKIIGDDLAKVLSIRERLIALLDDPRGKKIIKDNNTTVRHSQLFKGGEMIKNPDTGNYEMIVFFLIKI